MQVLKICVNLCKSVSQIEGGYTLYTMRKMKKKEIKIVALALASFLMLVCIIAASPDSTPRFIDPTPADNTQEQDFTWGVLAINTHKSIYLPDETAFLGIAVLDNEGHMVCDVDVTLTITDPDNKETVLSTGNGLIKVSPQCSIYGVTNLPDYYTNYTVGGAGTYVMNLTAVTPDGTKSITDEFTVQNSVDFDVARDGPTRIYPPVPYVMNFTITANRNYNGLIKEYVPASFVITPQDGLIVTTVGDTKILTWNKNLVKEETYNIYYEFDAPDVSPYLFTLGALEIGSFKEDRQWQIANDASVTYYFNAYDAGGEEWAKDAAYMVDGSETTFAYTKSPGNVELLTGNTCPGTDLGNISKVKIMAFGYYTIGSDDRVRLRPVFAAGDGNNHDEAVPGATEGGWGIPFDITSDFNASSPWTWSAVQNLDCDVEYYGSVPAAYAYVGKVEIIVTYTPPTWESYNCTERTPACQDDTFSGDEHTVYMHGTGFAVIHDYKVAYYDVVNSKVAAHVNTSDSNENLSSQYYFPTNTSATAGLWHSAVYDATVSPPSTYNPDDPDKIADDGFTVESTAIPEFTTVIAAIAVCMLCAAAYVVMRRKVGGGDG